jgi:predicted SAM-dependent methyltransferase
MNYKYINLGCGPIYVETSDWLNLDFVSSSSAVRQVNLLDPLPLADDSFEVVYSSHFLEHIPRTLVPGFLAECFRILKPGGVLRLVLPDLENLCREYLDRRDSGDHEKADFVVLEMIDQCVRPFTGGELGKYYESHTRNVKNETEAMKYVRLRTGEDLRPELVLPSLRPPSPHGQALLKRPRWEGICNRLQRIKFRLGLALLPEVFRTQNVSLASVGERHQWIWDFYQLRTVLDSIGFIRVTRQDCNKSAVYNFPFVPLDQAADGSPRKGEESMYVESWKPLRK